MELEEDDLESHVECPDHVLSVAAVLRNRTECDRILRRMRPSDSEKQLLQQCKAELQRALKPAAIWWTGSIGKGTSLSGSHDVDVCVRLGGAYATIEHALWEIAQRLQHSSIEVKRVEKKLVFALFEVRVGDDVLALELDILPDFEFGQAQVRHFQVFSEMNAAQKDTVRILKALTRINLKVPGVLLEAVVHQSVPCASVTSQVQGYLVEALKALSSRRRWQDPTDLSIDLGRSLNPEAWDKLQGLAKDMLELREAYLEPSEGCLQSYPCIHRMTLIDVRGRRHDLGQMNGFEIVEMYTRLGLRLPSHFKDYPKVKDPSLRQEACEQNFWSFWQQERQRDDLQKRSIQLGDKYLSLVKEVGQIDHPLPSAVFREFVSLMAECSEKLPPEASPVVAMFFLHKFEEAEKHVEVVATEEAARRARSAAMRAAEQHARQHAARQRDVDVRNSGPNQGFMILFWCIVFFFWSFGWR